MKNIEFDLKKSRKSYIQGKEQFIVVFDRRVYLRAVGEEGAYALMTATASEDSGRIFAYPNQDLLIDAAIKVMVDIGYGDKYLIKLDHLNRRYVEVKWFEYLSDVHRFAEKLFRNLDVLFYSSDDVESGGALRSLHSDLSIDDEGSDVYLSDGVWLTADGDLKDLGR